MGSIHFSTTTIPTTTLIPINIGKLTGHTYTVVNTLTETITSTATLTTSIKVTEISPTSTRAEISPTCTMKEISPSKTITEISSTDKIDLKDKTANSMEEKGKDKQEETETKKKGMDEK